MRYLQAFTSLCQTDNYGIAMLSFLLVLMLWKSKWSFSALLLFTIGMIISSTKVQSVAFVFGPAFIEPFSKENKNFN
jgi:hypothetical protein